MPNGEDVVLYHAHCNDGWVAAFVAYKALKAKGSDWVELVPCQYGQDLPVGPDVLANKHVLMVDFSLARADLEILNKIAATLQVLDHHKTAEEALKGLPYCKFDMSKSGAMLAWEHFHGGHRPPWYVRYAQDRDLWLHKLENSKEIVAAMSSYPHTLQVWENLVKRIPMTLIPEGAAIIRDHEGMVASALNNHGWATIAGHDVPCVNSTVLFSEIAGRLSEGHPFAAVYFERANGNRVFSLRSRPPKGLDVAEIARIYGGGGHKHAAGFHIEEDTSFFRVREKK